MNMRLQLLIYLLTSFLALNAYSFSGGRPPPRSSDWSPIPENHYRQYDADNNYGYEHRMRQKFMMSTDNIPQGKCRNVKADCQSGVLDIDGWKTRISCGRNGTTKSGFGRVGGYHGNWDGAKVPCGTAINGISGMGQSGGGRVFHTRDGNCGKYSRAAPPYSHQSKGCIIVTVEAQAKLHKCRGARLQVIGTNRGRIRHASAKRKHRRRISSR